MPRTLTLTVKNEVLSPDGFCFRGLFLVCVASWLEGVLRAAQRRGSWVAACRVSRHLGFDVDGSSDVVSRVVVAVFGLACSVRSLVFRHPPVG
jgi:hypothetical protein